MPPSLFGFIRVNIGGWRGVPLSPWPGSHVPPGLSQMFITGSSVVAGATGRLLFGHDSFGNVCGRKNSPVEGAPLSGQDMTLKK